MLFYEEIRNKAKHSSKSNKRNNIEKANKNSANNFKNKKTQNNPYSNSQNINNIKKSKSFFLTNKLKELKNMPNSIIIKKDNKLDHNKRHINNKKNKNFSYTFQNFYNNYPRPEPFPKKIDIRIINNNSNFNTSNINDTSNRYKSRENKNVYDDKKILFILTNLGLENIFCKFKDNFITYNDLIFLTKDDFIEMKIPIGPRNRIIHFIEELKKNGTNLDFEELRNFLEKYKKLISGFKSKTRNYNKNYINEENKNIDEQNNYNNNNLFRYSKCSKKTQDNSFILYQENESEKKQNNSIFSENNNNKLNKNLLVKYYSFNNNNKNKNNIKKKKFYFENNFQKLYSSENTKNDNDNDNIKKNKDKENTYSTNYMTNLNQINNLSYILNNKSTFNNNYRKRNNIHKNLHIKNEKLNSKTAFIINHNYFKVSHLNKNNINTNISKSKEYIPMNNIKRIYTKVKSRTLSRKNTYTSINNKNNNQNDSFHSNISYLSKNLLNKLEIINKEVEKYEQNYERLKNETKRRNKNVIRILSCNYFEFKKNQNFLKYKYNNSCQNNKKITFFDNNDLENEKERNLKLELNNFNYKIRNSKYKNEHNAHFFGNK